MGLIAIGDIHGCAKTLDVLLERLMPAPEDHLVFVGDYIDRGPDSKGVIERLLVLREEYECTFLRGNHEALMLEYLDQGIFARWRTNGGVATLQSYLDGTEQRTSPRQINLPEEHVAFVRDTQLYYDTPDFFFVHAGLKPTLTIEENLNRSGDDVFLWERSHLKAPTLSWEKTVVCGHTPLQEPLNRDRLIAIDTGCVYYTHPHLGYLTAVRLPEREFVTVSYAG